MSEFFEYIRNITYYLMFATVVGIFAPAGKYRKFVSLVMGFVLLLLIVQPLAGFFDGRDIPVTQWFAGVLPVASTVEYDSEYAQWWEAQIRGSFEAQLESQVTRLLNANGFAVHFAEFSYSTDFSAITEVRVSVSREEIQDPNDGRVPFIRIQSPEIRPIRIGEASQTQSEACPYEDRVKNLISEFYNLPKSHIYVEVSNTKVR